MFEEALGSYEPISATAIEERRKDELNMEENLKKKIPEGINKSNNVFGVNQKFINKQEEFLNICPELKGKNVIFLEREKSMDIKYGSISLNVAYGSNFPRDTRGRFRLDDTYVVVQKPKSTQNKPSKKERKRTSAIVQRTRDMFYQEHSLYRVLDGFIAFVYHGAKEEKEYVRITYEKINYVIEANQEAVKKLTIPFLEECCENAYNMQDFIKNYILKKQPKYKELEFTVSKKMEIVVGKYRYPFKLINIPSCKAVEKYVAFHTMVDMLNEHINKNLPKYYASQTTIGTDNYEVKIQCKAYTAYPIQSYTYSFLCDEEKAFEDYYQLFLKKHKEHTSRVNKSFLDLSGALLKEKICDTMDSVKNAYEKAGYNELLLGEKKKHPLYPILSNATTGTNVKLCKVEKDGIYLLEYCGYEFEYDLNKNTVRRLTKDRPKAKTEINMLNQLRKLTDTLKSNMRVYLSSQKEKFTWSVTDVKENNFPVGVAIAVSFKSFSWNNNLPLKASATEINKCFKSFKDQWNGFLKEQKKKEEEKILAVKKSPYYGDLFVADILKTITKIGWDPSISYLCREVKSGTGMGSDMTLVSIENKVMELWKKGVLSKVWHCSTKYDDYEVYQLATPYMKALITPEAVHYGKNKKYDEYKDIDWKLFLQDFDPTKEQSMIIWKHQLPVWNNINVLFACKKDLQKYYKAAPEQVKAYVKALHDTSSDRTYRKALKQYIA